MDSRKVASELIELSGGTSNIKNVTHCSTRLRFIIKDKSAVEVEAIKKCEGVLGVVFTTDELQMVFGKNVIPVYTEASKIYEAAAIRRAALSRTKHLQRSRARPKRRVQRPLQTTWLVLFRHRSLR